ncbi:hypothetical protein [Streptococcus pluranimalium]|uniref:hypothetical protein n=1 Tax=Streptococcus pluranimalium TaxID=82348 RepID=UPI00136928AA|nr:hypothetical protein [Streptococcus pluranimalium]MXQ48705.1 hypothetical protein [Streptococcus pneumoniae]HEM6117062.1 hypothetical protein [Streptococcus suis]MDY3042401.1 hypothetical protein [Streptococcus pluranimalium]WFM79322.1 hypothetical protein P7F70_07225 [Streptococcus pluranimalium]HEM6117547.1 hypothetical protein [Streptococcus suis]
MNQFEAFKATLSEDSLKAIYDETKLEVAGDNLEGTESFSAALATQMAINLVEKYHDWLNNNP